MTCALRTTLADLPVELLTLIARGLLPSPPDSSFPPQHAKRSLQEASARLPSTAYMRNLLAFALVSRKCAAAVLPILYSVLLLRRTRQLRVLANTLLASRPEAHSQLPSRVTDVYLTAHDGLREANDRRDDSERWRENLRSLFDVCDQLDNVCLTTMTPGSALQNFLHPQTKARPREVAFHNYSSSGPNLQELDLRPLGRTSHLHLVNFRPTRVLLDFLHGQPDSGAEHALGSHPLSHLRLSSMGGHTFDRLSTYIEQREQAMGRGPLFSASLATNGDEQIGAVQHSDDGEDGAKRRRARLSDNFHPDPRTLVTGQREGWAKQCLYNLAADADLLPNLRLVQIEIASGSTLPVPSAPMEREFPVVSLLPADGQEPQQIVNTPLPGASAFTSTMGQGAPFDQFVQPGQLATIDFPSDVPLSIAEAAEWEAQEREAQAAEERQRTAERDAYWLQVREGKEALLQLFREARSSAGLDPDAIELRVVLARPSGWSYNEAQAEFLSSALSTSRRRARGASMPELVLDPFKTGGTSNEGGTNADSGCWADEDVFELAASRPWLAIDAGDGEPKRGPGLSGWWTGELPRLNAGGDTP